MRTIPDELVRRYEAEGWWTRESLGDLLAGGLAAAPGQVFQVHSRTRPWAGTFADVERLARRLAAGLRARGVGPGDVIAMQLPNWVEAAATFWATSLLGGTIVPIVHFYGPKEVGYILGTARPKVFVTTERFGRMEFRPELAKDVPVVGLVGDTFDELLADEPMTGVLPADPAGPALIAFTSGTTRDPKGVVHSHRSLVFETKQLGAWYPPDRGNQLTAAPVGHFIGMINAVLIPVVDDAPIHLTDVWDPAVALRLALSDHLTVGGGAPYFVTSLLDHPDFTQEHLTAMPYAGLGGAPVPAPVTERLEDLGVTVFRSYGSTEHPSITGSLHTAPRDKRLYTDGDVMPGVEIRLTEDGEILSRGPDLCAGYTDPELTARAFDDEGWYHTGDIGRLDADGFLTIVDRKSDVIIRGGENVSAVEVEEALLAMPGLAEVAVVAVPDVRFGERAAAVVRLRDGADMPTLDDVRAHLRAVGLATQKWPEQLQQVTDFPRTPSGKVQKYVLRRDIAAQS